MSPAVHQLVPSMVPHDATADHTLQVQLALQQAGYESEVFALAVHPSLEDRVRLAHELPGPRPGAHLLYQYSSCSPLADLLLSRHEPVALDYHNVTPASFFHRWDRSIWLALCAARVQLDQLARRQPLGVCDSAFNADDLAGHGVARTTVVPVLVDVAAFDAEPDRARAEALERRRAGGGTSWLFVGAVSPHKAQHELVQALACYRRSVDPQARLVLVGRPIAPAYAAAVHRLVAELGLTGAVDVVGEATHAELVAHYRHADVFVTASRHEGFCVPLLEAMAHDLPVVARAAGAVPDTVGDAGVLVDGGGWALAAAVARVVGDGTLRRRLVAAGQRRLEAFSLARSRAALVTAVRRWTAGAL